MNAMADVAKPAVFSVVITILVFLPLVTLEDIEGKMFRPVVISLCFMLAGALFYALVLVPAVGPRFLRGSADAKVAIVEYTDYWCSFCARFATTTMPAVVKKYVDTGKVRYYLKDFAAQRGPKVAEAARCAGDQQKYWEMHDAMFANQRALEVPMLKQTARAMGLDSAAFDQCLDSGKYTAAVESGSALGNRMGVNSTPTLYVNGRPLIGAVPFENFKQIIDEELSRR
jgi:protein-disulfide isomerase